MANQIDLGRYNDLIDNSTPMKYRDFKSGFQRASKFGGRPWVTVMLLVGIFGLGLGAYQRYFAYLTLNTNFTQAADDLQQVKQTNTAISRSEYLLNAPFWWVTYGTRNKAQQVLNKAVPVRQEALSRVVATDPTAIFRNNLLLSPATTAGLPSNLRSSVEQRVTASAPIAGVVTTVNSSDSGSPFTKFFLQLFGNSNGSPTSVVVPGQVPNVAPGTIYSFDNAVLLPGVNNRTLVLPAGVTPILADASTPDFVSTGNLGLTIVPVVVGGQNFDTKSLQDLGSQIVAYFSAQSGRKLIFIPNVASSIQGSATGGVCGVPSGAGGGTGGGVVLYVWSGGCSNHSGQLSSNQAAISGVSFPAAVHEIGHALGLGHVAGGNITGDPMDHNVLGSLGSFTIVHQDILNWINPRSISADGVYNFSDVPGLLIGNGCGQGSNLYIDSSKRLFCRQQAVPDNYVDSIYGGPLGGTFTSRSGLTITDKGSAGVEVKFNGSTVNPPPPTSSRCTVPGCGNEVTIGDLGPMSLVCPTSPVTIPAGGNGVVELTATGDYRVGITATIPDTPGGLGPDGRGIRGRPTPGFRPGTPPFVIIAGGSFGLLGISVDSSVAPGNYNIDAEGYTFTNERRTVPAVTSKGHTVPSYSEPMHVSLFSTCSFPVHVTAAPASSLPSGVRMHIYQRGQIVDGQLLTQSSSGGSLVPTQLTWAASVPGTSTCRVTEGDRFRDSRKEVLPPGLDFGPYTNDTEIVLTCDGLPGGSGPKGEASVGVTILGSSRSAVIGGVPQVQGPHGLSAGVVLSSAEKIDFQEFWESDQAFAREINVGNFKETYCTKQRFAVGDTIPGTGITLTSAQDWWHCRWPTVKIENGLGILPILSGNSVVVKFASQNATSCTLSPVGSHDRSGTATITNVTGPVTVSLTCSNAQGDEVTATKHITIAGFSGPSPSSVDSISCSPNNWTVGPSGGRLGVDISGSGKYSGQLRLNAFPDNVYSNFVQRFNNIHPTITYGNNQVTLTVPRYDSASAAGSGKLVVVANEDQAAKCEVSLAFISNDFDVPSITPRPSSSATPTPTASGGAVTPVESCSSDSSSGITVCLSSVSARASITSIGHKQFLRLKFDGSILADCDYGQTRCSASIPTTSGSTHTVTGQVRNSTGIVSAYGADLIVGSTDTSASTQTSCPIYNPACWVQSIIGLF